MQAQDLAEIALKRLLYWVFFNKAAGLCFLWLTALFMFFLFFTAGVKHGVRFAPSSLSDALGATLRGRDLDKAVSLCAGTNSVLSRCHR